MHSIALQPLHALKKIAGVQGLLQISIASCEESDYFKDRDLRYQCRGPFAMPAELRKAHLHAKGSCACGLHGLLG